MARKILVIGLIGILIVLSNATKNKFEIACDGCGAPTNAVKAFSGSNFAISNAGATCPFRYPVSCSYVSGGEAFRNSPSKKHPDTICIKLDTATTNFKKNFKFEAEARSLNGFRNYRNEYPEWEDYHQAEMKCQKADILMDDEKFDLKFDSSPPSKKSLDEVSTQKSSPVKKSVEVSTQKSSPVKKSVEVSTQKSSPVKKSVEVSTQKSSPVKKSVEVSTQKSSPVKKPVEVSTQKIGGVSTQTIDHEEIESGDDSNLWKETTLQIFLGIFFVTFIGGFLYVYLGCGKKVEDNYYDVV